MHTLRSIEDARKAISRAQATAARLRVRLEQLKDAAAYSQSTADRLRSDMEERLMRTEMQLSARAWRANQAANAGGDEDEAPLA
jgi:hypothetical protein